MSTDSFELAYVEKRPSESQYQDVFSDLFGGNSWKGVQDALGQHAAEDDHTLTLSEICRAMQRKQNNAPYGFFASHLVKYLPIHVETLLISAGGKKHSHTRPVSLTKGYVTYAIAASSTSKHGETQWTLYPEVVNALQHCGLLMTIGKLTGQRVPLWALASLGFTPATALGRAAKTSKHRSLGERWDATGIKGWGVLPDERKGDE